MKRAVFLDRDGVLNPPEFRAGGLRAPSTLGAFQPYPFAAGAVASLRAAGLLCIVVTNQPDVAMGDLAPDVLDAMHARLAREVPVDAIYVCPHASGEGCDCRKPRPGLLRRAADEWGIELGASFLVGDRWRDIDAGRSVGCTTVLVAGGDAGDAAPDHRAADLTEAARLILDLVEGAR